jgi:hypothetical protein
MDEAKAAIPAQKPRRWSRQSVTERAWLDSLPLQEVLTRWERQGAAGFYVHERDYLGWASQYPEVRARFEQDRAERERKRAEVAAARHRTDVEAASASRIAVEGLRTETPGTVADAALRASRLYMDSRIPRTLRQCVAIAASEHLVAWQAIHAYLAGVGARVLWAQIDPEAVWAADGEAAR